MGKQPLADRVTKMEPSATIAMNQKSREMKAEGKDVISLSLGEPDFFTPDTIKAAAKKAIDDNRSFYPPIAGVMDLKKAICNKLERENGLNYLPEQVIVSTGAKQSIANAILALINPGDEVLLPAPYWVSYYEQIKLAGGIPIVIPTDINSEFKVTVELLRQYISDKTKMLIYSSPCNPSGSIYTKEEMQKIADEVLQHEQFYILADEIYEYITFEGNHASMASYAPIYDRTLTVNGIAKGFAMTGWRIGYLAGPKWIVDACAKIQGQFTSGANAIAQHAAIAAMNEGKVIAKHMVSAYASRKKLVKVLLEQIPGFKVNNPKGAFYFFPDVSATFGKSHNAFTISNDVDLCNYLLEEALVAVVPGVAFGNNQCIRISYATSEKTLKEAMKRIHTAIDKLK